MASEVWTFLLSLALLSALGLAQSGGGGGGDDEDAGESHLAARAPHKTSFCLRVCLIYESTAS